jgi:uncharacterized damage-inducible protein DinB
MTQISESSTRSATLDDVAPRTIGAVSKDPATLLFADLDTELATTRRMLERVPDGKDDWRPHKKSRTLDELATHVAQLPGFGIMMLTQDEFDGGTQPPEPKPADCAERVEIFDEVAGRFRQLVKGLTWDQALSPWTLKFRGQEVFSAPRAQLLRSAMITHLAHHRAQLGVYLRLLDVPVPSSYGPTADEGAAPRS